MHNKKRALFIVTLSALIPVLSLMVGVEFLTPLDLWQLITQEGDRVQRIVFWELRLPRILIACFVGAALATAGGVMQGITRNALASPDLTGVVAGSSCMIVILTSLFSIDAQWFPLAGISGGLIAGALTFALAWKNGLMPLRVILAGVAISSVCIASMTGFLIFSGAEAGDLFFWLAGGIAGRGWMQLEQTFAWVLIPLFLSILLTQRFRVLLLDDAIGQSLGIAVSLWRLIFMLLAVIMTAGAVTLAGPVGFVGLVVPHITRKLLPEQSVLWLPLNALVGSGLLLGADILARLPILAQEIPLGVVMSLIGAPWLLWLLKRQYRTGGV
ncbi:FecCD family ABC transporter permease [Oceanospirillum linum]|uniref:FecCD family ABC transporter permease n=1 Tax=Oceanospirillum linum TaxID=966 RepID=UPI001EE48A9E|nr:iron ABC transporter permease [Oceanospirillum linum]